MPGQARPGQAMTRHDTLVQAKRSKVSVSRLRLGDATASRIGACAISPLACTHPKVRPTRAVVRTCGRATCSRLLIWRPAGQRVAPLRPECETRG
ncbi:unnamed protein product [Protopolystoma xenopodis]|uniref:Uncharacterized protein n=1 Tax=Protopolystoma xenopodis TaxID=117903 RepID=A0A448WYX2_9PLAT|nr:unnamed protein product [Protopolystoma xenopodis]